MLVEELNQETFEKYYGWIWEAAKVFNPYQYTDDETNDFFGKPRRGESLEDFEKRTGRKYDPLKTKNPPPAMTVGKTSIHP